MYIRIRRVFCSYKSLKKNNNFITIYNTIVYKTKLFLTRIAQEPIYTVTIIIINITIVTNLPHQVKIFQKFSDFSEQTLITYV